MPAYCGYAWVPIAGMPGHRLRPLFHEIVGWNAMDLMREFLQKSRVEGLTNHGGYATITPTSIERLATLNGKSHKTPVRRQGTASETTPRIITHRRPVARPRMAQIPPHCLTALGQRAILPVEINHNKPFNDMSRETQTAPRGPRFSHTQSSTGEGKEESHDNRKSTQWKAVCGKSARTV